MSTAFQGILNFPAAHYAKIKLENCNKKIRLIKYWKLKVNKSKEIFDYKKAKKFSTKYAIF